MYSEDQPFCLVPRVFFLGSFSISSSQLLEHEALSRKTASAISHARSTAKYVHKQLDESNACLHHLKLDLGSAFNFSWRTVHNYMLMHHSIALENLSRTICPIDEDQKVALLHTPFKGTTLFGGELAKLQQANMEVSYSYKRGGWDRDHYRSAPLKSQLPSLPSLGMVRPPCLLQYLKTLINVRFRAMKRPLTLNVPVEAGGADEIGNSQNEGVPPQPVPVWG